MRGQVLSTTVFMMRTTLLLVLLVGLQNPYLFLLCTGFDLNHLTS
jgi:hypothetical protein